MAKKQVSETIKQQRKARKDFLELKKMQSGEIDTGPKPSEVAIVPKTFKEKLSSTRIESAKILIESANMPMQKAAEYVGYKSYSGFWKAFGKTKN